MAFRRRPIGGGGQVVAVRAFLGPTRSRQPRATRGPRARRRMRAVAVRRGPRGRVAADSRSPQRFKLPSPRSCAPGRGCDSPRCDTGRFAPTPSPASCENRPLIRSSATTESLCVKRAGSRRDVGKPGSPAPTHVVTGLLLRSEASTSRTFGRMQAVPESPRSALSSWLYRSFATAELLPVDAGQPGGWPARASTAAASP